MSEHAATAESTTEATAAADRVRTEIDESAGTVTREGVVYRLDALTPDVTRILALRGLRAELGRGRSFDDLLAGKTSDRRTATPKVDHWHEATALAIVEKTKKTSPQTIDQARATAAGMNKDQRRAMRADPVVVKHYNKLIGGESILDGLLNGSTSSAEQVQAA